MFTGFPIITYNLLSFESNFILILPSTNMYVKPTLCYVFGF